MSRLIADARRQQQASNAEPGGLGEPASHAAEPQLNPLAGARPEQPNSAWRGVLITLAYLGLAAVLLWQGWQWWQTHRTTGVSAPERVATPAEPVTEPMTDTTAADIATDTLPVVDLPTASAPIDADPTDAPDTDPVASAPQSSAPPRSEPRPTETATTDTVSPTPDTQPEPITRPRTERPVTEPEPPATTDEQPTDTTDSSTPVPDTASTTPVETRTVASAESADHGDTQTNTGNSAQPDTDTVGTTAPNSTTPSFSSNQRTRTLTSIHDQFQSGDRAQALSRAANHLRQDDHTESRQLYARLLLRDGQAATARTIVRPGHNMAELELRAYADYQVEAYSDALRHYQELLRRSTTPQQEWYLWLAICHDNLTDSTQAIGYYRTYLSQTSGQPDSLLRYARNRLQQLSD